MWTTQHTAETDLPRDAVWAALRELHEGRRNVAGADRFELDGPFAVGSVVNVTPAGQDTFASTIVELEEGLNHVADRMDCDDLRWVVMATRIQREVGGNLAEVLKNTVDTMRERAQTRRHVRALSAEGRLSGYIIVCLPIVLGAWLSFSKPQYMSPLYTTPFGLMLVGSGVVLMIVGSFWIRALIKVEA